jgi:hypothetical protein
MLVVAILLLTVTAASAQWTPAPSAVIAGVFCGFDHKVPLGKSAESWLGIFTAVKAKTLVENQIWLYTGAQYGDALTGNEVQSWGGNARLVFKGREDWPGTYFWISPGWLNHIGNDLEAGITAYVGGSMDLGSGFNLMIEYGWQKRGAEFASQAHFGVGIDAWDILTAELK